MGPTDSTHFYEIRITSYSFGFVCCYGNLAWGAERNDSKLFGGARTFKTSHVKNITYNSDTTVDTNYVMLAYHIGLIRLFLHTSITIDMAQPWVRYWSMSITITNVWGEQAWQILNLRGHLIRNETIYNLWNLLHADLLLYLMSYGIIPPDLFMGQQTVVTIHSE